MKASRHDGALLAPVLVVTVSRLAVQSFALARWVVQPQSGYVPGAIGGQPAPRTISFSNQREADWLEHFLPPPTDLRSTVGRSARRCSRLSPACPTARHLRRRPIAVPEESSDGR